MQNGGGLSNFTKPCNDDKGQARVNWIERTNLDNVQGEFIEPS
jgi:hypothetical protein